MKKKKYAYIVLIILLISLTYLYTSYRYRIYNKNYSIEKELRVEKGESLYGVLRRLGIERDNYLRIYMRLNADRDFRVEVGNYNFLGRYKLIEVLEKLQRGKDDYIVVTIPEGFTLNRIGRRLEEVGLITRQEFEEGLREIKDFYYPTPNGNFEGYFFPDTYYFSGREDAREIINRFLERFLEVYPPNEYLDKESFYDKLILASIVEKEAGHIDEMPLVSSVFHNRLNINMRLQSCATIAYLFDFEKDYISYRDLQIDSVYNTYRISALPPAPISNPGRNAMRAVYEPIETDYFYFVLQENGRHHFSRTYNEHIKAQRREGRDHDDIKIRVNR